jgi:hypothetical protein
MGGRWAILGIFVNKPKKGKNYRLEKTENFTYNNTALAYSSSENDQNFSKE